MNARERILSCIRHDPIDRVPISTYELVGWNEKSWENSEPSYRRLMDAIREYTDCIYMSYPETVERQDDSLEVREWDEGDRHFTEKVFHTPRGDLTALYRTDRGIYTTWTLKHPLRDISDIDRYLSMHYESPEIRMDVFDRDREALGDRGVMMISVGDPICEGAELYEMGDFLVHAMTEPKKIKFFLDAIHERQMSELTQILKHDVTDVLFRICGPEYATPPYLSPSYFYEYVTCYLIEICREIKAAGGIPRIHSHGKIAQVVDQFCLTEAVAIDPVEPPPDGDIALSDFKRLYGDRFCIFGNLELKELEHADRNRIDRLVRDAMEAAKAGGGFVLMPTSAPINTPLSPKTEENYLQMIESALKYGGY